MSGAALILLVFGMALLLLSYQVYRLRPEVIFLDRAEQTAAALSEARQLLIARAVLDQDRPGSLPCPDADANGSADLFKGNDCPQYLGRFPWRTLGSGKLTDASGELLWYALSSSHRDDDSAQPIHAGLAGLLKAGPANDVVAVVLAPGFPLPGQTGRPGTDARDYLEAENANGDQRYDARAAEPINDRIVWITRTELMRAVAKIILKRIAGDERSGLLGYRASTSLFPDPDIDGDGYPDPGYSQGKIPYRALTYPSAIRQMLSNNDWFAFIGYSVGPGAETAVVSLQDSRYTLP